MNFSVHFFRSVAISSILSALTTLLLMLLPRFYQAPASFEEGIALRFNSWYFAGQCIYFVHPFLVITAAWGVVARKWRTSTGSVTLGFLFFVLWAFTEAAQQALSLWANNFAWREGYATASDETMKLIFRTHIIGFGAIWDALFFLLLTGFFLSNVLFGIATMQGKGLERIVSICFFMGAFLTLLSLLGNYGGLTSLSYGMRWLYPFVQPLARLIIGIWLW